MKTGSKDRNWHCEYVNDAFTWENIKNEVLKDVCNILFGL